MPYIPWLMPRGTFNNFGKTYKELRRLAMLKDKLRLQTLVTYTQENPKNTMRVLDNLFVLEPKTYYSGITKIPASTNDPMLIAQDVNHVVLISDSTFTLTIQEHGTLNANIYEEMRQFNYSGNKPVDIYVQNPLGIDVNVKTVYANDK